MDNEIASLRDKQVRQGAQINALILFFFFFSFSNNYQHQNIRLVQSGASQRDVFVGMQGLRIHVVT